MSIWPTGHDSELIRRIIWVDGFITLTFVVCCGWILIAIKVYVGDHLQFITKGVCPSFTTDMHSGQKDNRCLVQTVCVGGCMAT